MPNIHDVAKKAGVSVATVSRVLNKNSNVKAETKALVEQAVIALNYEPARKLKSERVPTGRTVMILIPDISNPFYAMIVKGMGDLAMREDCSLLTCMTNGSRHREEKYLEMLKSGLAMGAIFLAPEISAGEIVRLARNFPLVQCCEYKENAYNVSHVSIDNLKAGRDAVQHLVNLGHRKIAMISCDNGFISNRQREQAYLQTLQENGILFEPQYLIRAASYEYTSGQRAMNQLLRLPEMPTAVFAVSDFLAFGAIQSIRKSGLRVPEDIAVTGFDDIEFASIYTPSLTSVYQPQYDLGYTALKLLLDKMDGTVTDGKSLFFEHELRIRGSTVK